MSQPDTPPGFALTATFEGTPAQSPALSAVVEAGGLDDVLANDAVRQLHVFTPDSDKPVIFDDGDGPAIHLEFGFDTLEAAIEVGESQAFAAAITEIGQAAKADLSVGLYRIHRTPLPGRDKAERRTAPMSFMVRYYGPVDNPPAFAKHYIAHHPDILATFPGIKNVLCYEPVAWDNPPFALNPVIVGNEVVFDSVADLNAAMSSSVMKDLRADSAEFPSFGHSTHVPMQRRRAK